MAAGVVGDHGVRHAVLAELPGGQRGALVARPRLVDPDMDGDARVVRQIDRRGRGAPIDGREPAGVAMGQHVDALAGLLLAPRSPRSARGRAGRCAWLIATSSSAISPARRIGGRDAFGGGSGRSTAPHLVERPSQVDRGRPRREQRRVGALERRVGGIGPHRQRHRHRRRWRRSAARRAPAWSGWRRPRHRSWSAARRRNRAAAASGRSRRPTSRPARARCCGCACRRPSCVPS